MVVDERPEETPAVVSAPDSAGRHLPYSIVETYPINPALQVAHFDLYRLVERDALYHIGFDDFVNDQYALLIEWPEAYVDALPTPTLIVDIALCSEHMRHVVVHASQDALLESLTSWKDV